MIGQVALHLSQGLAGVAGSRWTGACTLDSHGNLLKQCRCSPNVYLTRFHSSSIHSAGYEPLLLACLDKTMSLGRTAADSKLAVHDMKDMLMVQNSRPSYKELEELLRSTEGSNAGKTWVERIKGEFAFNRDSLDRR